MIPYLVMTSWFAARAPAVDVSPAGGAGADLDLGIYYDAIASARTLLDSIDRAPAAALRGTPPAHAPRAAPRAAAGLARAAGPAGRRARDLAAGLAKEIDVKYLAVFAASLRAGRCGWNGGWIKDCFGHSTTAWRTLLSQVSDAAARRASGMAPARAGLRAPARGGDVCAAGVDQGVHNALSTTGSPGAARWTLAGSVCYLKTCDKFATAARMLGQNLQADFNARMPGAVSGARKA
ncbi:hypothetical protein JL721_9599 [Aureococcus anophagefferens]|nr:hypothetical protein JL721_9599 [Aureococcus anophagefferens]